MQNKITAIIIAGGKSSRMGTNKAMVVYKGMRLIDHAIQTIRGHCQTILISSNSQIPDISYPFIADEFIGIGPMGGLYSAIKASKTELNLVIPCDVPNLEPEFYSILIDNSNGFDAVIPRQQNGKLEPLIACYKKTILPVLEECIASNDYKMVNFLNKIKVKYIDIENAEQFRNMNSPNDLL